MTDTKPLTRRQKEKLYGSQGYLLENSRGGWRTAYFCAEPPYPIGEAGWRFAKEDPQVWVVVAVLEHLSDAEFWQRQ